MNSLERVLATLHGKKTDRIACSITSSMYGASLIACNLKEYYNTPELYTEGQIAVAQNTCTDVIFTPFALPIFAEAAGAKIKYFSNNPPNVCEFVDYSPEKSFSFDLEKMFMHQNSQNIIEISNRLTHDLKNKLIAGIGASPCDLPAILFGIDKWLHTLLFHPKNAKNILLQLSEYFLYTTNKMFDNGISIVVVSINFANNFIVTEKIRDKIVLPLLKDTFGKVKGPIVIHHGGPDFTNNLKAFEQLPNVIGYVIGAFDNFEACRKQIAENKLLIGNYDGPNLVGHSPEMIKKKVNKILLQNINDKFFIWGTSNADIAYNTPLKHLKIIEETIQNFNKN